MCKNRRVWQLTKIIFLSHYLLKMKKFPQRWLKYSATGVRILGTRFVPFKAPISDEHSEKIKLPHRFTPQCLIAKYPNIKLVIDLTSSNSFYRKQEFTNQGIEYFKLMTAAKDVPQKKLVYRFFEIVDDFHFKNEKDSSLIGVHCTHGVNRTAYFIGSYMIQRLGLPYQKVILSIEEARGHKIERVNYLQDLEKQKFIEDYESKYVGKKILQSWVKSSKESRRNKNEKIDSSSNYIYSKGSKSETKNNQKVPTKNKFIVVNNEVGLSSETANTESSSKVGELLSVSCKMNGSVIANQLDTKFNTLFENEPVLVSTE